jgi:hypothetical protein
MDSLMVKTQMYMFTKYNISLLFIGYSLLVISACQPEKDQQNPKEAMKINFPEGWKLSADKEISKKILIYLNADCSHCILQLISWYQAAKSLENDIPIYLVVHGPSENLFNIWLEETSIVHPYIWDEDNALAEGNPWLDHEKSHFLILNAQNQVLFREDSFSEKTIKSTDLNAHINM